MKSNLCVRNWLYSPLFHKDQERREIEVTTDCFLSIVVSTWPLFFLDNSVLSQMVSDSRFVIYLTRPHSVPDRSLQSTPPDSSFIENCDISAPWTFVGFINDCRHSMTTMRKSVKGVIMFSTFGNRWLNTPHFYNTFLHIRFWIFSILIMMRKFCRYWLWLFSLNCIPRIIEEYLIMQYRQKIT